MLFVDMSRYQRADGDENHVEEQTAESGDGEDDHAARLFADPTEIVGAVTYDSRRQQRVGDDAQQSDTQRNAPTNEGISFGQPLQDPFDGREWIELLFEILKSPKYANREARSPEEGTKQEKVQ